MAIARNTGAAIAKGEILIFIDSDTQILSDYLEFIYKKFKKTSHLVGLSASFKFSKQSPKLIFAEEVTNGYLLMRSQIGRTTLPGFNTCVLKDKFKKIGGFKSGLLEDVQLSRDLNLLGKTEYFSEKKVITSSRKLEKWGVLGTLRYYFELGLAESDLDLPFERVNDVKNKVLEKAMKYKGRKNVR